MPFVPKLTRRQTCQVEIEAVVGSEETVTLADAIEILDGASIDFEANVQENRRLSSSIYPAKDDVGRIASNLNLPLFLRGGGIVGQQVQPPEFEDLLLTAPFERDDTFVFCHVDSVANASNGAIASNGSGVTGTIVRAVRGGLLLRDVSGALASGATLTSIGGLNATLDADPTLCIAYLPTSDLESVKSATIAYNRGGHLHVCTGARSDFAFELPVGQTGTVTFTPRGRFKAPVDSALIDPDFTTRQAPPIVELMALKVGDYTPVGVTSFGFNFGGSVTPDEDLNDVLGLKGYQHGAPSPTVTINPKADDLANFDPFEAFTNGTLSTVFGVLGSEAGNRIYMEWLIQYDAPSYGDRDGYVETTLNAKVKRESGDACGMLVFF